MVPRGRPPGPGTAEEKAAIRRERVRLNVKAYRERKKKADADAAASQSSQSSQSSLHTQHGSTYSLSDDSHEAASDDANLSHQQSGDTGGREQGEQVEEEKKQIAVAIRSKSSGPPDSQLAIQNYAHRKTDRDVFWYTPQPGPIFSVAFLSVFRTAFLPTRVSLPPKDVGSSSLVTPCSPWITNAFSLAMQQDHSALKSGIVALGLIINALQKDRTDLKVASFQVHKQALRQLRNDLGPITLHTRQDLVNPTVFASYLTCLAIAMFEMLQFGFSSTVAKHLRALNSLIEITYNNPGIDQHTADLAMEDFSMLDVIVSLKHGLGSMMRHTKRKIISLKRRKGFSEEQARRNASVYGDLFDIVQDLPSLVLQSKSLRTQSYSVLLYNDVRDVVHRLSEIEKDIDAWRLHFESRHGSMVVQESCADKLSRKCESRLRLRSYEHGAVGVFGLDFHLQNLIAIVDTTTALVFMQQQHPVQYQVSVRANSRQVAHTEPATVSLSTLFTTHVVEPSLRRHVEPNPQHLSSDEHETGLGGYFLRAQRAKLRLVTMQLVEILRLFSDQTSNLSGRSLLVSPCESVRTAVDKEHVRLLQDLDLHEHSQKVEYDDDDDNDDDDDDDDDGDNDDKGDSNRGGKRRRLGVTEIIHGHLKDLADCRATIDNIKA